jgi:hypothetical protein
LRLSNPLELCSDHYPDSAGAINKDPTVWLDEARPHPKHVFKNNMSLTNSKTQPVAWLASTVSDAPNCSVTYNRT